MLSRREFLTLAAATASLPARAAARQELRQEDLLAFPAEGEVTILHVADIHAQLEPVYLREPAVNLGVGDGIGLPPHVTGRALLDLYGIAPGSHRAYTLASDDFVSLAKTYGKVGGMDRLAALIAAIRAERGPERVLLLDGGDTLQGSYTALRTRGADMVAVLEALGAQATTGHWEFTLGAERIAELYGSRRTAGTAEVPFLAGNVFDNEFDEPVFAAWRMYEKGGVPIAVIGQAFPYTPIANPRWMMPRWSFGIRERKIAQHVAAARAAGAQIVVLLSHNGFEADRKLAGRVAGIDVILAAHTHDALPRPVEVGRTLIVASGSHGKFLSRLDVETSGGRMTGYSYALIPVLSDVIAPDPRMSGLVARIRRPYAALLATELARTEELLYRRDTFAGTFDELICAAMLAERDAELCFSPGFRWGATLLPGQSIRWEDVFNATAMTYPACYRLRLTGEAIKAILEDAADNVFNTDPYARQGGDMVRVGGLRFTLAVDSPMGRRISNMTLMRTGEPVEPQRGYVAAGWASVNPDTQGPPIWDVVAAYLQRTKIVEPSQSTAMTVERSR